MAHTKFTSSVENLGDGKLILTLKGEIDIATRPFLEEALRLVVDGGHKSVIIDGSGIEFMDSQGVSALISGKKLITEHGTRIILVVSDPMRRVLELVAPTPLFADRRVDSVREAMALLDGSE